MEITWLGHACFRLKGSQAVVITDPYSPDLGYDLGKANARIVTVSHPHPGHNYVAGVSGDPKVVHGPGEYEIGGILLTGIPTFHDSEGGGKRGKNTAYLMEIDGISVLHLGDLGHALTDAQTEAVGPLDVLLVPVGGVSTIDAAIATEVIRTLEPTLVIPMHYKTPAISRDLAPVETFLKEMGLTPPEPQPKISVTRSNLPLTMQVVILSY
ncbi:MAG: MBL fold metallo-hydrolase [Chloroflexota bacterium]